MSNSDLKKSLYQAVMKAMNASPAKKQTIDNVVSDIEDPNMIAQVPKQDIPATKESVLRKEMSVSEMHQQKQANAEASVGMLPGQKNGMQKANEPVRGIDKLKKFMENSSLKKSSQKEERNRAVSKEMAARGLPKFKTNPDGKSIGPDNPHSGHSHGINKPWRDNKDSGTSVMGHKVRNPGDWVSSAKEDSKWKLDRMKSASKPNLPKSEMAKSKK